VSRTTRFIPHAYRHPDSLRFHFYNSRLGAWELVPMFGGRELREQCRWAMGRDGGHRSSVSDVTVLGNDFVLGWAEYSRPGAKRAKKREASHRRRLAAKARTRQLLREDDY